MEKAILLVWFLAMIVEITALLLANLRNKKREKNV